MKEVIIMRGISGSGKSTLAQKIKLSSPEKRVIVSADDFFTFDSGEYLFDPTFLKHAHEMCKQKFLLALEKGVNTIIVDNTNTKLWECEDYIKWGKEAGYLVFQCMSHVLTSEDALVGETFVDTCFERCVHDVPREGIKKQLARMERINLPHYYLSAEFKDEVTG